MARKIIGIFDPGDSSHVGTSDFDYINQYLTGTDQSVSDPVTVNTSTTYGSGKLVATSPVFSAPSFSSIVNAGATLTLPTSTDTLTGRATTDTLTNKTITSDGNTLKHSTTNNAGDILVNTGTKFDRFAIGTANQVLAVNATANGLVWTTGGGGGGVSASSPNTWSAVQTFNDGDLGLRNSANTFTSILKSGAQTAAQTFTFPVTASDTIDTINATQTLTNKTLTSPVISTISNTGTLTLPTSTDTLVGRATTDTLTNKTMSYTANTFTGFPSASGMSTPDIGTQFGNLLWSGKSTISGYGRLGQPTQRGTAGTAAVVTDATGPYHLLSSAATAGSIAGISFDQILTKRAYKPKVIVKFACTHTPLDSNPTLYVGFHSNLTPPTSDTVLASGDSGVLVGWQSTSSSFVIFHNDGTAAQVVDTQTPTADTNYHTITIFGDDANSRFQVTLDANATVNVTTRIPATGTALTLYIITCLTTGTTVQDIKIPWVSYQDQY